MRLRALVGLGAALLSAACIGERPRPGPQARRVAVDPDVVNFSRRGDQLILAGRVYRGTALASDTGRFAWRAMDSTVAAVGEDGVVTARGDGVTRIWGVSGTDSAFAVIVVQTPVAPAVVTVTPAQLRFSALTAVSELAVRTSDTLTLELLPTCRSDNPAVAVVEGLTVRARGAGTTRIRCSIAGVQGGTQVTVRQRIVRVRVTSEQPFAMRVGRDSLNLSLARVDSLRQPVARGVPRFVSLDTGIVQVDPVRGTAVAMALGTGRVVGSVEGLADTAEIRVVDLLAAPTVTAVTTRRGGATGSSTRRPGVRTAGTGATARAGAATAALGARAFQGRDSIFQVGATVAVARPARWGTAVFGAAVERRVDGGLVQDDTSSSTGAVFGFEGEATPARRLRFRFMGLFGSVNGPPGEAGNVSEVQLDLGVAPLSSWLWVHVGGGRRALMSLGELGQWTSLRLGTEARFGFGKGQLEGLVRFTYLPTVSVTDATSKPSFGLNTEVGVNYHNRAISAGVQYGLERLDFPSTTTGQRREQFAVLRFRFGLEFGR